MRSSDPNRSRDLAREARRKRAALEEHKRIIGIKDSNANDYVESCYDIILFSIRSHLYADGFSSSGSGAHEAEVAYARTLGIAEDDVRFLDMLRTYRNGILYRGSRLDAIYARQVYAFMERVYEQLEE